ncbi:MAG TPA: PD-(D/E)XK nuclease family protein [Thermomicrobiales bacterium]|nr:PD-(D/E)XK nuclease family protein [Thermomicrobiales bacterium]
MAQPSRRFTPTYWVNHLTTFEACPQKYFLKHVRKRKGRIVAAAEMTRGRITHEVLAQAFKVFAGRRSFPADLRGEIEARVTPESELARVDRVREIDMIHDWVDAAVESFDPRKSVHVVERSYGFSFRGKGAELPFIVKAKVDLLVRVDAVEIEHIDWKTGRRHPADELQAVVARIAVGSALDEARVRSTTTYLSSRESDSRYLTRDEARPIVGRIRSIAREIDENHVSGEWAPIQSRQCERCQYYQHGCILFARSGADPMKDDP